MLTTTLARIRKHSPCEASWRDLLAGLGKTKAGSEPLPYSRIVQICGIDDALWATCAEPKHTKVWRLYACACAYRVVRLNDDPHVRAAIDTAVRHADGTATDAELSAAKYAASNVALNTTLDARAATWAAWAASDTAWDSASNAVWATWDSASNAISNAASDAEHEWQRKTFIEIVGGTA